MREKLVLALLLDGAILCACCLTAGQTRDAPPVGDGSGLVVVPTFVFDKVGIARALTQQKSGCAGANPTASDNPNSTAPWWPGRCDEAQVRFLTPNQFHVFEDGVEQKIKTVTAGRASSIIVWDNRGQHQEYSRTPGGKWSTADGGLVRKDADASYMYWITYAPPKSEEGRCHRIKVKVDRPHSLVFALNEYCNGASASDPLKGTKFGKEIERDLASGKNGRISLLVQAGFLYTDANKARAEIAVDFPWSALHRSWEGGVGEVRSQWRLDATIGLLGMIYKKDGALVRRLSDLACCSSDQPMFVNPEGCSVDYVTSVPTCYYDVTLMPNRLEDRNSGGKMVSEDVRYYDVMALPSRYEAQVELPPGEYDLEFVLSDDRGFGRAQVPLNIEPYDGKELALSSVLLCKRFVNAAEAAQEATAVSLAPRYVPLVSTARETTEIKPAPGTPLGLARRRVVTSAAAVQVTPTGDTRFKKGEPLIPYFEVYEPVLAAPPATGGQPAQSGGAVVPTQGGIQGDHSSVSPSTTLTVEAHIRIVDAATGQLVKDFPPVDAAPYERAGSSMIPIAREIPFDQLPKAAYRLEVQATDSAGRSTPWRAANFSVE